MARHPQWIIDTEQRTHPAISIDPQFRHLAEKRQDSIGAAPRNLA